jgi:2-polyprenyl-3-methyl-5-hydroxy-6-metoxy-1,4-benzoquinol methylase
MTTLLSPLTQTPEVTFLKSIATAQLIEDWRVKIGLEISEEFRGHEFVNLYRCDRTGLEFFTPVETAASSQLYGQLMALPWYYLANKWEYGAALKDLRTAQWVLEVGSGSGAFLGHLRDRGIRAMGIEYNEAAVAASQTAGFQVENKSLKDLQSSHAGQFDAICSFQVLEHVVDPLGFLQEAIALLKPGGKLLLAVPNRDSFLRHYYNVLDMPPHHMTHWCDRTFKALTDLLPVQVEHFAYEYLAKYHIPYFVEGYAQYWSKRLPWGKWLTDRQRFTMYETILNRGPHRLFRGHTLYVCLKKEQ